MARRWVLFLLFPSALLASAHASVAKPGEKLLRDSDSRNAEFVAAWLRANAATADQKASATFFRHGQEAKARKNWSLAAKTFGESMIRYPTAQVLFEYIGSMLRMLGDVRAREPDGESKRRNDMAYALDFYKSALAADAVLGSLPTADKEAVHRHVDCLSAYLQQGRMQADCPPLRYFRP
jgi:hypothetical protein